MNERDHDSEMPDMNLDAGPRLRGLISGLVAAFVVPFLISYLLVRSGLDFVYALAISALVPLGQIVAEAVRARRVQAFGALSLLFIVIGLGASFLTHDPRFALAKESLGTGVFAVACLVSLAAPRPLMFYLGREFATGDVPELLDEWDSRWRYPFFRRVQYTLTTVWGVAFALEAIARVLVAMLAPPGQTLWISPLLGFGTTFACIAWTLRYVTWAQRRGTEMRSAARAATAAAPTET